MKLTLPAPYRARVYDNFANPAQRQQNWQVPNLRPKLDSDVPQHFGVVVADKTRLSGRMLLEWVVAWTEITIPHQKRLAFHISLVRSQ